MALVSKAFADLITFTRASSGGRFNSSGVYEWLGTDQPRFDYAPLTLAIKGLLIEEQRTNLLAQSANPTFTETALIFKSLSVLGNADGATAFTCIADGTNRPFLAWSGPLTAGQVAYSSIWIESLDVATDPNQILAFSGEAGSTMTGFFIDGVLVAGATVGPFATPVRLSRKITAAAGGNPSLAVRAGIGTGGLVPARTLNFSRPQLEVGAFATSYIPTAASQVTRAADIASVGSLSPWYNAAEGTLFVEATALSSPTGNKGVVALDDTTTTESIRIQQSATPKTYVQVIDNNSTQLAVEGEAWAALQTKKIALGFKENDIAFTSSGAVPSVDTVASIPTVTKMQIGKFSESATYRWSGHIRAIKYFPKRIPNADLQALTA